MALRDLVLKRLGQAIITVFIALVIDFYIFNLLPGSFIDLLRRNPNISEAAIAKMEEEFGLNKPLPEQFLIFLSKFLQGDFGKSLWYGGHCEVGSTQCDVGPLIFNRLINTMILLLPADIIAIYLGVWIGKQSAWRRETFADAVGWNFATITYAIPAFWLGITFLSFFGFNRKIFPTDSFNFMATLPEFTDNPFDFIINTVAHLALPFIVLVIAYTGVFALIMRNSLLETISEDYMITAKAKGRNEQDQLNKEAFPNARIPVATVIAIQIGYSVIGVLLIEIVFNYHGIGRLIWDAVGHRDYPLLQASFFMFTVVLIITNVVVDLIYFYLDPRISVVGPEIKQARDSDDFNQLLTYILGVIVISVIILGFFFFENDHIIAYTIFNGTILVLAIYHRLLKKNYKIHLPDPIVLIIITLTLSGIFLFDKDLDLFIIFMLVGLAVIAIIKWDVVLHTIKNFLKKYKASNLTHDLRNNWVKTLIDLSVLIIVSYLVVLIFSFILDFIYVQLLNHGMISHRWFDIVAFSDPMWWWSDFVALADPIFYLFWIAFIGLIGGTIITHWNDHLVESNKGIFGLILVFFFFLLAIFGDLIAPYNPDKIGVGPLYSLPTPVSEFQFIMFVASIGIFLFNILVNSFFHFKSNRDLLSGLKMFVSAQLFAFIITLILDFVVDSILSKQLIYPSVFQDIFDILVIEVLLGISMLVGVYFWKIKASYLKSGVAFFSIIGLTYFLSELLMNFINLIELLFSESLFAALTIIILSISIPTIVGVALVIIIALKSDKFETKSDYFINIASIPSGLKLFSIGVLVFYLSLLLANLSLLRVGTLKISSSVFLLILVGLFLSICFIYLYFNFNRYKELNSIDNHYTISKIVTLVIFIAFLVVFSFTLLLFDESHLPLLYSILLMIVAGISLVASINHILMNFQLSQYKESSLKLFSLALMVLGAGMLMTTGYSILSTNYRIVANGTQSFHLFGTNALGQDVFSQIVIGVRVTLLIAILATLISVIIGTSIGITSGYYGGLVDSLLMRFTDLFFVLPAFVLMIIVAAVISPSLETTLIVIGIFSWAVTARLVRAQALSIKERPYVDRVRSIGGSDIYIMFRHILPGILPIIIVQTILLIINSIFFEIGLAFVGLGDPQSKSWGYLLFLADQQGAILLDLYWLFYPPGIAIIVLLLGFAYLGFSLDEITNPKLRRR
ncbi:MAG: ABC transporter permease subunit [Candidatus Hodarchaeales archaeon]|jgi:ABC-type dipeptide/oligopeptide/nickel transport system permease component